MRDAGIDPDDTYITNAVKHFKFVWRGKRRIHVKPKRIEVRACQPWLLAEIAVVRPRVLVALGATAAQGLPRGLRPRSCARSTTTRGMPNLRDLSRICASWRARSRNSASTRHLALAGVRRDAGRRR